MKKYITFLAAGSVAALLVAQTKMDFHLGADLFESFNVSEVDTIRFNNGFITVEGAKNKTYKVSEVDSLTFATNQVVEGDTVFVRYNGDDVDVLNPYTTVNVVKSGADVVITSSANKKGIVYCLSGSSKNGSFTITPDRGYTLCLDNLDLTSSSSAAMVLNAAADGENYVANVHLRGASSLADAASSSLKGALYTKSKLKIADDTLYSGTSLAVRGNAKHAINSSKRVELYSGKLEIMGAASDGINADGVEVYGGELAVAGTSGDGIDCSEKVLVAGGVVNIDADADDVKAIKCDSVIEISGGELTFNVNGAGSKAVKSGYSTSISGGVVTAKLNATAAYTDASDATNISYNGAFTSNGNIEISGSAQVNVSGNGIAAKAVSADGSVTVSGGTLTADLTGSYNIESSNSDTTSVFGIKADGAINITDGTVDIKIGENANIAKGLKADNVNISGGNITINNNGGYWYTSTSSSSSSSSSFGPGGNRGPGGWGGNSSSGSSVSSTTPKCIRGDKSVSITGGTLNLTCAHGKGITSDEAIVVGKENGSDSDLTLIVSAGTSSDATYTKSGENSRTKYCAAPKALNCEKTIDIYSGTIEAKVYDTGIKAKDITINGGKITIDASMDQGIHGLNTLTINDGDIYVSNSYEAFEAITLTMNGGITSIYASNDGWNASVSSSGLSGTPSININGGYHYLNVGSGDTDCLDSNGGMSFTGGVLIVEGGSTLDGGDGNYSFTYTGGKLMLFGSGVENAPTGGTKTSGAAGKANTLFTAASNGTEVSSFTTTKSSTNLMFFYSSSVTLTSGSTISNPTKTVNFRWTDNTTLTYTEGGSVSGGSSLGSASESSFGGGGGGMFGGW